MINLTDEMVSRLDSALADGYSCLVGTASKDGEPQISPKGSVMAFDRDTLAYWERAKRSALDNVAENPQVVVYYAHAADRVRWRFHGEGNRPRRRSHSPGSHGPLRPSRTGPGS